MRTLRLFLLCSIIGLTSSCKKQTEEEVEKVEPITRPLSITFGDSTEILIIKLEKNIKYGHDFSIELDFDGFADILFTSGRGGGISSPPFNYFHIEFDETIGVLTTISQDTVYEHTDTIFSVDTNGNIYDTVIRDDFISCQRRYLTDKTTLRERENLLFQEKNEIFSPTHDLNFGYSKYLWDYTWYGIGLQSFDCEIPKDKIVYIGFAKEYKDNCLNCIPYFKLGWIKLEIPDFDTSGIALVYEVALQK